MIHSNFKHLNENYFLNFLKPKLHKQKKTLKVYIYIYIYIYIYSKCPKISNTLFHTFLAEILLFMHLSLKMLSGMANNEDPDQTAPSGAV